MASNYNSELQSYEQANAYLGSKKDRPLPNCSNLRIERITTMLGKSGFPEYTGEIVVKLHGNTIVHWDKDGNKTFPYKGMYQNTITTKRHRSAFGGPWKV